MVTKNLKNEIPKIQPKISNSKNVKCSRGEIWYANLGDPQFTGEQAGIRPVLIIQNDVGNFYAPTLIVAPLTSAHKRNHLPTHVHIEAYKPSVALLEQIQVISKSRLVDLKPVQKITKKEMQEVNMAICRSLGLDDESESVKCKFKVKNKSLEIEIREQYRTSTISIDNYNFRKIYNYFSKKLGENK